MTEPTIHQRLTTLDVETRLANVEGQLSGIAGLLGAVARQVGVPTPPAN